ncbi:AAA family ATPase [Altererythrobacter sp. TH136]|uniref:AAA family ATPase n=1 Tax=Altererythrobacter sp. TH136 TaxID=2067415 RepID=UPI00143DE7EF|nr:AAA family ATPase [Altererythrobacter sp. TH136]
MAHAPDPQRIAAVLGGVVNGDTVHCPTEGHSNKDRGTTVKVDANAPDGVLVHTFNGGDALAVKDRLREAGIISPLGADRPQAPPKWRETGVHVYDDRNGEPVFRTRRLEALGHNKRFVAERFESGSWVAGLDGVTRLPYRFTELVDAAHKARAAGEPEPPIFFVEGERKADKLASWGFLATAVAFGANGWREEYGEAFGEGTRLVILPDNDAPGLAFAERVKTEVEAYGGSAIILELPGLPPKGDIIDWTGTAEDLRALADKALAGGALPMPTLDLDALSKVRPIAKVFAVERLAPLAEVTLFTGAGSAGKSLLGQQLATCAAAGLTCLGVTTLECPAIYLTCEDDEAQLHWRQERICEALGVRMDALAGKLHLISLRGALDNELGLFAADGTLTPAPAFDRLQRMLKATGAKIVALDNVAHLFAGNENSRGDVTRFVNLLNRLAGETGAAVFLIGHPNKSGADYSGSTAWLNAVRSQIVLTHDLETDVRTLTVGKANYAEKGEALRFLWVDGAFVREDSLPPERAKELAATIKATADNDLFLTCLRERVKQQRAVSERRGPTYAPTEFAKMVESKSIGKDRLEAAMDRLFRINAIERALLWNGPDRKPVFGLRETIEGAG